MDNLETPYDEDAEFIECRVCEKSIRGETLYKIHLTTPGHLKKEDVFVAAAWRNIFQFYLMNNAVYTRIQKGLAVKKHNVPIFEDIIQYLDYMKLDEPIIGLNFLEEGPCTDPQAGPRYTCRLCHQTANLQEMVRHVIGRKHRQKFVELKRPDLVTWDKQSIITQGGKIIRARAEIVERQDGRGTPSVMTKKGIEGKLNISRVPSRQKQTRDQNFSQRETKHDVPSNLPRLMDIRDDYPRQRRFPPGQNTPPFYQEDSNMLNRDRQMQQRMDTQGYDPMEDKLQRADYRESDVPRQKYMNPDSCREYEDEYVEDPQRRSRLEPVGFPRYDSRVKIPPGNAQRPKYYPEENSSDGRHYPENDPLKEFYTEELRRERVRSAEYQPAYPERDNHRHSLERESGRRDNMNRAGWQGLSEPETERISFPKPTESGHLFKIRDYHHRLGEPAQEEVVVNPGPSRMGPPNSQRQLEMTRSISDIPEPFRRFLEGASNSEGHGKRKRKSRFSDATAEEMESIKEMFSDQYGPPNPKFGGPPRSVSAQFRPEIQGIQHPGFSTESQGPQLRESYQREGSESAGVFDMLNNIEIENAEEADFLKNKLCELLRDFKSKKSQKAGQNSHGRAVMSKDSNSFKLDSELSQRHQYETMLREDSDLRQHEDFYFEEDQRGRGWKQHEHTPDKRHQEYRHPVRGEPRHPNTNRDRYEGVFGQPEMSVSPPDSYHDEPAHYPERFQKEHIRPSDYRPAAEEFDLHSSAPPLHMERGLRMERGPRYSNNLDKITSTLLELVARK